ncbi:fucolectin-like [Pomacea canaliculata]|uniref:fucolectin-like n=1 Tax=Pomacea canaliculata TaxID=400727 RepID=UPI000D73C5EF|nr:fucolectin-like [Pomacea canaliculata]
MTHLVGKPFFTHLCLDTHRFTQVVLFCIYLYFLSAVLASENVALRKPARIISSAFPLGTADKVVDGDTNGYFYHYSCTHTYEVTNTWWKVDLMGFYNITSVQLFTRTDCCSSRLQNFEVRVSDLDPTTFPSVEGQRCVFFSQQVALTGNLLNCSRPITGRYVSVYKPANDALTICEIFVFGTKLDFSGTYQLVQDNSRLNSSAVTSLTAPSRIGCAVKCTSDVTCLAFNVMASGTSSHGVACELLGLAEFSLTLQAHTGWRAYRRVVK